MTDHEDRDAILRRVADLEQEHFQDGPCSPQRCSHLTALCDCFFMLTGSHAKDCPAYSEEGESE